MQTKALVALGWTKQAKRELERACKRAPRDPALHKELEHFYQRLSVAAQEKARMSSTQRAAARTKEVQARTASIEAKMTTRTDYEKMPHAEEVD